MTHPRYCSAESPTMTQSPCRCAATGRPGRSLAPGVGAASGPLGGHGWLRSKVREKRSVEVPVLMGFLVPPGSRLCCCMYAALESVPDPELEGSRILGHHGAPEERRGHHPDVGFVVHLVQYVEGVEDQLDLAPLALPPREGAHRADLL